MSFDLEDPNEPSSSNDEFAHLTPNEIDSKYEFFCICFSLHHGAYSSPFVLATSVLGRKHGSGGIGIVYVFSGLSALFLASPSVSFLGPKRAVVLGMSCDFVFLIGFAFVGILLEHNEGEFSTLSKFSWYASCTIGGIGSGILWTAQGAYFAAVATLLSKKTGAARESLTATLTGRFAFVYLVGELVLKEAFAGLEASGLSVTFIICVFCAVTLLSVAMMMTALPVRDFTAAANSPTPFGMLVDVVSMWGDPLVWLLSTTNLTFGFTAALMNARVNSEFVKPELGEYSVTLLSGVTVLVAAVFSMVFGRVVTSVGKTLVIVAGALAFLSVPMSLLIFVPCIGMPDCKPGIGWGITFLFVAQGVGRAVFESTNRAVLSDLFVGSETGGAFANYMLQVASSSASAFFLQSLLSHGITVEVVVIVLSLLTIITHPVANVVGRKRKLRQLAFVSSQGGASRR